MPTKKAKPIPDGYHTVTPHLIVRDSAAAIDFYKKAFGAEEIMRMPGPGGAIMHAEIAIGDSRGDLEVAEVVGRFYLVANALAKDPGVREAIPAGADVAVTEEPMTAGFYEAIVRSLAEAR